MNEALIKLNLVVGFWFKLINYRELYMNELMGPIPAELGQLKSLVSLDLYHNDLTGSLPSSLSNLNNLKFL